MAELLLRLFHSDYFSPHLALSYLKNYSENIGITYYLVEQLQATFKAEDVEFYWPQLCHLLITKPSDSLALENFILQRCTESVHIALVTLWHFQAARFDLSADPKTPSFQICKRVINRCQSILFDDTWEQQQQVLQSTSGNQSAEASVSLSITTKVTSGNLLGRIYNSISGREEKIHPANALTTIIGVGASIGSVGMPRLASIGGPVAISQGRKPPEDIFRRILKRIEDDGDEGAGYEEDDEQNELDEEEEEKDHAVDGDGAELNRHVCIRSPEEDADHASKHERKESAASASSQVPELLSSELLTGPSLDGSADQSQPDQGKFRMAAVAETPSEKTLPARPACAADEINAGEASSVLQSHPPASQMHPQPQRSPNPFATFASTLNDFKDRAAAAVGDAIGQHFQIVAPPAPKQTRMSFGSESRATVAALKAPRNKGSMGSSSSTSVKSDAIRRAAANSQSTPNLPRGPHSAPGGQSRFVSTAAFIQYGASNSQSTSSVTSLVSNYSPQTRSRLLRVHYSRTQTDFLAMLQNISGRLLLLPKPARLSALRAELTDLNHSLPKEVCFPLWCQCNKDVYRGRRQSKEQTAQSAKAPQSRLRHHRVVRINPSEAVVLNSADRVPYLLHVEVLNNDLDFDPDRRSNRDAVKKLIAKEEDHRRRLWRRDMADDQIRTRSLEGSEPSSLRGHPATVMHSEDATPVMENMPLEAPHAAPSAGSRDRSRHSSSSGATPTSGTGHSSFLEAERSTENEASLGDISLSTSVITAANESAIPEDGEGIDLTEQMYGADLAKFGGERGDDDDSDEDDLTVMNRHHDSAAWTAFRSREGNMQKSGNGHAQLPESPTAGRKNFSLDDYSERMRTAAIMLAQLNQSTNAGAQPIVTHNPHVTATAQGGWSSWIIGTSWASSAGAPSKSEPGQAGASITAHNTGITPTTPMTPKSAVSTAASTAPPITPRTPSMQVGCGAGNVRLLHADAEGIRKRIMQEMMALEEERMSRTKVSARTAVGSGIEDEATVMRAVNKDDPSAAIFRESWAAKKARIRASSPYGHLPNWDIFSVIVKTGADLRQEQLAVQLVNEFGRIFEETSSRCWVRYFRILVTSENSGLMETITDAISIHSIKKEAYSQQVGGESITTYSLYDHFVVTYGHPNSIKFKRAQDSFMQSLAGYSIISYLLQIKDRHNGNILVDDEGHLIHIDFGFMLGISPGGVGFEAAPFKMPQEYIDILGGMDSTKFQEFHELMRQGFKDVRKHAERIIMIVELMQKDSKLPCFALAEETASNLRNRFQLALSASQCDDFVDKLILNSAGSAFTRLYDQFQYYSQGIL
ncbi:hypothetical protein K437DRAFT_273293 [Tilletiaria anomala UBC 951]|uniref:1-phosphatidylinositol 4-kinase n=1 Tax=Tilletiaria anomala (strain ATCC 24038 / CBS 436.72 / UBC 951) TaxID=1037660 RepID=A0A066W644_TILAU|nr:uncharacterized protein K437DRAFT_273293 [Tilletiaria anomala UBC 951]KDN49216.1 hypothetical protein K437DRAFT_273293 [Tilletiaria anomala UBC 951]